MLVFAHTVHYKLRINSRNGTAGLSLLTFFLLLISCTKLPLENCPDLHLYLKCLRVPVFRVSVLKAIRNNTKARNTYVTVSFLVGLKPSKNTKGFEQCAKNFEPYSNGKSTI